jgi:hypothetical protein
MPPVAVGALQQEARILLPGQPIRLQGLMLSGYDLENTLRVSSTFGGIVSATMPANRHR